MITITQLWALEDYLEQGGRVLLTRSQRKPPDHEVWTEEVTGSVISPSVIQQAIANGDLVCVSGGLFENDGQLFAARARKSWWE